MTFSNGLPQGPRVGLAAAIAFAWISVPSAYGQSVDTLSVNALKGAYQNCERAAMNSGLDNAEIMRCSVIYEELKRRAFDGDYRKLKAWWDAQSGSFRRDMREPGALA